MSRASGMVKFNDGTILHCIYDGTVDIMHHELFDISNEAWDNWYSNTAYKDACTCNGERVLIHSDYGEGETYTGKACKEHKCITFDFHNFLECEFKNREMGWSYGKYTNEQIEQEIIEHEKILRDNWSKSGKHFD